MNRVPLTVFHLVQYGVEAEFIPSFQKFLQPEGGFLLFTETAFLTESLSFPGIRCQKLCGWFPCPLRENSASACAVRLPLRGCLL